MQQFGSIHTPTSLWSHHLNKMVIFTQVDLIIVTSEWKTLLEERFLFIKGPTAAWLPDAAPHWSYDWSDTLIFNSSFQIITIWVLFFLPFIFRNGSQINHWFFSITVCDALNSSHVAIKQCFFFFFFPKLSYLLYLPSLFRFDHQEVKSYKWVWKNTSFHTLLEKQKICFCSHFLKSNQNVFCDPTHKKSVFCTK